VKFTVKKNDHVESEEAPDHGIQRPEPGAEVPMKSYTAVIERCPETGLYVGYVPGFPGAHSQGATFDELQRNLQEVIEMLLADGEPRLEAEFVGILQVVIP
jgi:predicted RNase H-like HicB family nuclease